MLSKYLKGVTLLLVVNILTLACISYIDYVRFKIPNVLLCGWVITILITKLQKVPTVYDLSTLIASLLVTGSFFPFRHIVKCNAGDFKLFGGLTLSLGVDDALLVILISLSFSFFPFAGGVKKVPIGFITFFGYVVFLVFRQGRIV